jgi:hypothetical protein
MIEMMGKMEGWEVRDGRSDLLRVENMILEDCSMLD